MLGFAVLCSQKHVVTHILPGTSYPLSCAPPKYDAWLSKVGPTEWQPTGSSAGCSPQLARGAGRRREVTGAC